MLGISESVVSMMKNLHDYWKYKAVGVTGHCDALRLSGEDVTSIGN